MDSGRSNDDRQFTPANRYTFVMLPRIAIVGRPNVGKSSLLNMLARRRVAIVDPTAGVTRDRVATDVEIPADGPDERDETVEVIDTGGYGMHDNTALTADVERQIAQALAEADLVLFVVDAQAGLLPLDHTVARLLREGDARATPVVLVANKVDEAKHESDAFETLKLGFGEPVMVSATTGHNRFDLYRAIRERLDFSRFERDAAAGIKLAIVGKRNAGKSTLVNALAGDERVIVSEIPGTTRDAVDVRFDYQGQAYVAIDTAGLRKRKSVDSDIEYYSHHRALRSVRRADVCLLVIDAAEPVSQVDRQLAHEILKHHRPTIIVVNKWDLAEAEYTQEQYVEYLDNALKGLSFAPIAFVSGARGEGMAELLETALSLHEQAGVRVATAELNDVMERLMGERGPAPQKGRRARVYYATQVDTHPPTIALFVNDPNLVDDNYQRFLINRFHELLPHSEVPIKLLVRGREHARGAAE